MPLPLSFPPTPFDVVCHRFCPSPFSHSPTDLLAVNATPTNAARIPPRKQEITAAARKRHVWSEIQKEINEIL